MTRTTISLHPSTLLIINQKQFEDLDGPIQKNLRIAFLEPCINGEWLIVVSLP